MSYQIVYGKSFIKTTKGIIPLILSGSSNCWDANNRRERCWTVGFNAFKQVLMTSEAIMQGVDDMIAKQEAQGYFEMFVYSGKWITKEQFVNFYKNGIKNAKTIEQIIADGKQKKYGTPSLNVYLSFCGYENEVFKQYKIESRAIKTTEELEKAITELLPRTNEKDIFLNVRFDVNEPITFKPTSSEFTGKAILKYKAHYVVKSDVLHRMVTTKSKEQATVFTSYQEAETYRKTLDDYFANAITIVKFTLPPTRDQYIYFTDEKGSEGYFTKATRGGGFRYSYEPSKAFTYSEAEKIIAKMMQYRRDCNFQIVSRKE